MPVSYNNLRQLTPPACANLRHGIAPRYQRKPGPQLVLTNTRTTDVIGKTYTTPIYLSSTELLKKKLLEWTLKAESELSL